MYPEIRIIHEGIDIQDKVISYTRAQSICSGVGTLDLIVEWVTGRNIQPWDVIILREAGRKKGTYFVSEVNKSATSGLMDISCQDGSKKLTEYFIPDIYNINYETYARYWIEKFLTDATISYEFSTDSQGALLAENFSLGPTTAYDTIQTLLQNSGWYMYFDNNNTCHIGELEVDLSIVDKTFRDYQILRISKTKDDKMLRNRAVIWGSMDSDIGGWVYADLVQHTPWDRNENDIRTVIIANSMIRNTATAYELAAKLLKEFAKITYIKEITLIGEQNVGIGDVVRLKSKYHSGEGLITNIISQGSSQGLLTIITLDQRCPRIFGYASYLDYVYVGTNGQGVWRKPLDSNAWESFSVGLAYWDITDLIIKNGIFACIADGHCYVNTDRVANWQLYDPLSLTDLTGITYPLDSYEAIGMDIDSYTNNILIGYKLKDEGAEVIGEFRSWILEITPELDIVSNRQIFIVDQDHQDFKLIDVSKYSARKLGTAEAPFSYVTADPSFWGTRKVYTITDPDPKAVVLGPPPECATYDDAPLDVVNGVDFYVGKYYEDSTIIIEGNAVSGFLSWSPNTTFTYDVFQGETKYNVSHVIPWPLTYGIPFDTTAIHLKWRIVYRKAFTGSAEDRLYHICDITRRSYADMLGIGGDRKTYLIDHYTITPLVEGYPNQVTSCSLATTENITLEGDGQWIDGYLPSVDTRILVKDQDDPKENGIYLVKVGTWQRTNSTEPHQNGLFTDITQGSQVNTAWQIQSDSWIDIGNEDINWVEVLKLDTLGSTVLAQPQGMALADAGAWPLAADGRIAAGAGQFYSNYDRRAVERDGFIYYMWDDHYQYSYEEVGIDPPVPYNPFAIPRGSHIFRIARYDVLKSSLELSETEITYTTDLRDAGEGIKSKPSRQVYSVTELIPAGGGYGVLGYIYTRYPKENTAVTLLQGQFDPGSLMIIEGEVLWNVPVCPVEPCDKNDCYPEVDNVFFYVHDFGVTGYTLVGKTTVLAYVKFRIQISATYLYRCCLGPGKDSHEDLNLLIAGVLELSSGVSTIDRQEYTSGTILTDCHAATYGWDAGAYTELAVDYGAFRPLQSRTGDPVFVYGATQIYGSKSIWSYRFFLEHNGLIASVQDDFSNCIYVFENSTKAIYGLSAYDGSVLYTIDASEYEWPVIFFSRLLYTNGYFIFIHNCYQSNIDGILLWKIKDALLFPGKYICFLLEENPTTGATRGLDYGIKDFDYYDLELENSQEFPLVSWTINESLIIYSGCDGIIYSGGTEHLKHYSIELDNVPISGEFNDTRIFNTPATFPVAAGAASTEYGRFIAETNRLNDLTMISSESIDPEDLILIETFPSGVGKVETSNSIYPYLFVSISGVGFYQRDPGGIDFDDYYPSGFFVGEIQTIRIDDRV